MSVLAQLPAAASAEETAAACLDGLDALLAELGLLAGEGPTLVAETRGAVAELAREADVAHGLGLTDDDLERALCPACGARFEHEGDAMRCAQGPAVSDAAAAAGGP